MKIELKHLTPYLPYGLKLKCHHPESNYDLVTLCDKKGLSNESISNVIDNHNYYKPILRPLSDLEKSFKYKGHENFKPSATLAIEFNSKGNIIIGERYKEMELNNALTHINYLFQMHFDVFGLIEKGLAIDINTLND